MRPIHRPHHTVFLELHAATKRNRAGQLAPIPDDGAISVWLEAPDPRSVGRQQQPHLFADAGQDLLRGGGTRDQRRDPPQRRLLLGEPLYLPIGLRVGNRRGHQLAELRQARLGVGGQRFAVEPGDADQPPYPTPDNHGTADPRAHAQHVTPVGDRAGDLGIVVGSHRPSFAQHPSSHAVVVDRYPRTNREGGRHAGSPDSNDGRGAVSLTAQQRAVDIREYVRYLFDDLCEHLRRRWLLGYKRGHLPQRRLLVYQPAKLANLCLVVRRCRRAHPDIAPPQRGLDELEQRVLADLKLGARGICLLANDLQADSPPMKHLIARNALPGTRFAGRPMVNTLGAAIAVRVADRFQQVPRVRQHDRDQLVARHPGVGRQQLLHPRCAALRDPLHVSEQHASQQLRTAAKVAGVDRRHPVPRPRSLSRSRRHLVAGYAELDVIGLPGLTVVMPPTTFRRWARLAARSLDRDRAPRRLFI